MLSRLRAIPDLHISEHALLADYTRFGLGGAARTLVDASTEASLLAAIAAMEGPWTLIGGGSNLVASDTGFEGTVLRYTAADIRMEGSAVKADAGVVLQDLVNQTIASGLRGLQTMTGIPGWVGGAIYGNAGAYGHSIHESIVSVRYFDGTSVQEMGNAQCGFRYRESVFKRRKDWILLSAKLELTPADPRELQAQAESILKIRNEKYPPTMRCAGSIFKNLLLADLPESVRSRIPERVIREGKVPSAFFLEQIGAKGMILGGIKVADYHANLLYNQGGGTAAEVHQLIEILKDRVHQSYGLMLEEEVQYL